MGRPLPRRDETEEVGGAQGLTAPDARCWLCDRALGRKVEQHHTVPKSRKGRETVPVHPICHRAIHAHFTNAALVRFGADRSALIENAAMAKFIAWVANKPPDFHAPTRAPR